METAGLKTPRGYRDLLIFYFLQEGTNQFLLMVITTLFLKRFGAEGLPWYYIGNNIIFITSQMLMMRWDGWKGHGFLKRFSKVLVVMCVVLAFASPLGTVPLFLTALFFGVYYLHSYQNGAEMIGQILSLQESKFFLARVFAAGTAGCILGGLALKFLVDTCGFTVIFLVAAMNFLINDFLLGRLKGNLAAEAPVNGEAPSAADAGAGSGSQVETGFSWARSPNIRSFAVLLWVIAFLAYFSRVLVDYLYSTNLSQFIPSETDLAGFFGMFGATLDMVVFLSQTFLVGKIFQAVSLGALFAARAGLVAVVGLLAFLAPSVTSISASQFIVLGMTWTFINPASLMLLEVIPELPRSSLRRWIAMGEAAANILVGLFLLHPIVTGATSNSWLYIVVVGISGVLFLLTTRVGSACVATVEESLRLSNSSQSGDLASLRFLPPDEACRRLSRILAETPPEQRLPIIVEAGEIPSGKSVLLEFLPTETSSKNLVATLRILSSGGDGAMVDGIGERMKTLTDAKRLAAFIDGLGLAEIEAAAEWAAPFLNHPDLTVRQSAMVCIVRAGYDPLLLRRACESVKALCVGSSRQERSTAARVMGALGLPLFVPQLGILADDPDLEVAGPAFHGLAAIPSLAALKEIGRRRESAGPCGELAQAAWNEAGQGRRKVLQVLGGLAGAERDRAVFHLQSLGGNRDFALVSRILRLPQARIREGFLRFLGDAGAERIGTVAQCLKTATDGTDMVSGEALLARLRQAPWNALLPDARLLTVVGGIEDPAIASFLTDLLRRAWKTAILPLHPAHAESGAGAKDPGQSPAFFPVPGDLRQVLAFATDDPEGCLDTFGKMVSSDRYLQAVSQEYLEMKLGKPVVRLLSPFFSDVPSFPESVPPECHDLLREAGLPIPGSAQERTVAHS